jgi:hypothetical protein
MNMPPPPPPGPGAPYGAGPGWGAAPSTTREHPDGTTVLVLGILGIVVCGLIAPFAWAKGNRVRDEMAAQPHVQWTNQGSVNAGRICGIIGTVIIAVWAAIVLVVLVVLVAAGGTG